jgi:hypothetical protein
VINWQRYRDRVAEAMTNDETSLSGGPIEPQIRKRSIAAGIRIADAIVNGYVAAISEGGDPILNAAAVLNGAAVASFYARLSGAAASPDPTGLKIITTIVTSIPLCWAGAIINAAPERPLPGHIRHSPVSSVLNPGVMPSFSIPPASTRSNKYRFIDSMIAAMKAHLLMVGGLHPAMILPSPAPPYPLPWIAYT